MTEDLLDLDIAGCTLKVRRPPGAGPHPVIFLIHGWTGDERSMWVFAPRLPAGALLIAPRAPYVSHNPEYGGYSWVERHPDSYSPLPAFDSALDAFDTLLAALPAELPGAFERLSLVGFSQGAALSFAFALRHLGRVGRLASLAGFLPSESESALAAGGLAGKPVFIAHGTRDERVPIGMAHAARDQLQAAGAAVTYCESDTGHKLGANCARGLESFFIDDF